MPITDTLPIGSDNDEGHYESLIKRQIKDNKNQGTTRNHIPIPIGSTVVVKQQDGGPWNHDTLEGQGS